MKSKCHICRLSMDDAGTIELPGDVKVCGALCEAIAQGRVTVVDSLEAARNLEGR